MDYPCHGDWVHDVAASLGAALWCIWLGCWLETDTLLRKLPLASGGGWLHRMGTLSLCPSLRWVDLGRGGLR